MLRAAADNGIEIPNLCFDGRVELYGACGLCVVEAEGIPKLLRACSTKLNDGMIIHTESERILRARKTALELLLSDHDGDCKAPCTLACPANTDCQGYVGLIANGEYKEAVKLIKDKIPLPSSIGRICPHPCEKKCRRQFVDEPISIAGLKAFASDMDMASNDKYVPYVEPDTGKRVAIVGGGPGGLTAAYFLRRLGHSVNVFDMMPKMGGMLRYGIPEYRLPKKLLDREITQIEALGVNLKNNVRLGRDIELEELRHDFDAVVIAAGAWKSSSMRIPGEELNGVFGGIDFLREVSLGNAPVIGKTVAVIGGGVVGALISRELSKYDVKAAVLERCNDIAMGTTKANSAIVHGGFDAVSGTVKAKLNVEGTAIMPKLCKELNVPYRNNGSLVVAFSEKEMEHVHLLYDRGIKNRRSRARNN